MAAPRITIVQLDPLVPLDRFGGWLRGAVLRNVPAYKLPLPAIDKLGDGVLVLGGRASVPDATPGLESARQLMVEAVDRHLPLLAICLGHQLLADAFGGQVVVGEHGGGEHGPVEVDWHPTAAQDPVIGRVASLPGTWFPSFHDDVVTRLPAGAIELARSAAYRHQAFRIGSAVGVQFHPEASPDLMARWEEMRNGDPITMRRSMRILDDNVARNGALVAQGFVHAAREHAESAPMGARRPALRMPGTARVAPMPLSGHRSRPDVVRSPAVR